ncbi:MAG: hypothetical protein M1825_004568 [Sarcosagium campestre]|nr:MAG: hypothetical protein M1825_004568 [Sarcosagium campestre]
MVRNPGGSAGIKLPPNTKFWREQVDALASSQPSRSYVAMKSTFSVVEARTVPQFAEAKDAPQASFSGDGRHLVAYSAIFPTAVWIFTMEPDLDCIATLVHLREVRQVAWHPSVPGLLLVECEDEDGEHYIYLWSEVWEHPRIIRAPLKKGRGDSKAVSQWATTMTTTTTTTTTGGSATATRASLVCGYETQSLIGSVDLEPSGGLHTGLTDASKRMKGSSGKENESPGIGYKGGVEDFLSGDW